MKIQVRYANHPDDSMYYTTEELRNHYLMERYSKKMRFYWFILIKIGLFPAG